MNLLLRRALLCWAVAAAGAVTTVVAIGRHIEALRAQIPEGGLVEVVVAARDIEAGERLEAAMLRTARMPAASAPSSAVAGVAAAEGSEATVALDEGQAVTARTIGRSGPSSLVPPGLRAYDVLADVPTGSALAPRQGDRVDVIVVLTDPAGQASAGTILRHRLVAAVGGGDGSTPLGGGDGFGDVARSGSPGRITLLVTPEEAEQLAMAESYGRIRVVLAPAVPDDTAG